MALPDTVDTLRECPLQEGPPQVIRLDTRSDTLLLICSDIAAKDRVPQRSSRHQRTAGLLLRRQTPSPRIYTISRRIASFPGIATVSSRGAELSALPDALTDGSIFIFASTTIGIAAAMPFLSIHSSSAGRPAPSSMARHLPAPHGLKVGQHLRQRCSQPNQTRPIHPRIQTAKTGRHTPAAAPRHHQTE